MSPAEIDAARKLADEARARADAATKGPWTVANVLPRDMREVATAGARFIRAPGERDSDPRTPPRDAPADYYDRGGRDAAFIAHARADVPALADALTAALDALAAAEARAERAAQWQALAEAATATHAAEQRAHERALDALVEVTARAERAEALLAPVQEAARKRQGAYCDGLYDGAHLERALFEAAMNTIAGEP